MGPASRRSQPTLARSQLAPFTDSSYQSYYDRNLGSGGHGDGGSRSNSEWQRHYLRNPTIDSFRRNRQQNESSIVPSDKR